jgi:general nucleoside transport system permease protein
MISFSNSANRIMFTSDGGQVRVDPWRPIDFGGPIFSQYWITYATFLFIVPLTWWLMRRSGLGLKIRAVGENPEAADVAGIDVTKTRYTAILIGSIYMAAGGAFITLAFVGSFTINIINGRGWVALALVIFGRWKIGRLLAGAALFSLINAGQLQLRLLPSFSNVPFEILLALPYLAVIIGLAVSGRNIPYPGAYLKPYKRH